MVEEEEMEEVVGEEVVVVVEEVAAEEVVVEEAVEGEEEKSSKGKNYFLIMSRPGSVVFLNHIITSARILLAMSHEVQKHVVIPGSHYFEIRGRSDFSFRC